MVARTTNALAVASGPPGKHWLNEHGTHQVYHGFLGCMVCTLRVAICIPSRTSPLGIHITTLRVQIPYTLDTHGILTHTLATL